MMGQFLLRLHVGAVGLVMGVGAVHGSTTRPAYRYVDLHELMGGKPQQETLAVDINGAGDILVMWYGKTGTEIGIWRGGEGRDGAGAQRKWVPLELSKKGSWLALGMNDFGQVLLESNWVGKPRGLWVWTPRERRGSDGELVELDTGVAGSDFDSNAMLGEDGCVVGSRRNVAPGAASLWVPTIWVPDRANGEKGRCHDLVDRETKTPYVGKMVNGLGWVASDGYSNGGLQLWRPSQGDKAAGKAVPVKGEGKVSRIQIRAMSDSALMVGQLDEASKYNQYLLRMGEGERFEVVAEIGWIAGVPGEMKVSSVNSRGEVVGGYGRSGFYWSQDTGTLLLTEIAPGLPGEVKAGTGLLNLRINEAGRISGFVDPPMKKAGRGPDESGRRAFLLVPVSVPTPSAATTPVK